ncbi:efflux RND transporter periplasmic adaptor subunit [Ramlibacter sp. MAHUQ-53]|uniref:efflux RND transporter periplasmic adaptor subunit n=1 Tax=unclassified Ramlibacter TaxID=2617605 RepID=UPI0036396961
MRVTPRPALPAAFAVALALALAACSRPGADPSAAQAAASAPAKAADPMSVRITPAMAAHFKVAPAAVAEIAAVQEVTGRIDANEQRVTRIGAAVTGRITEVLAEVGDSVRAGQTLARIASPELTSAQLAYLRASSATALAERAVERARQLIQADVIGSAELQRRESELAIARAESRAAADQLRLLGLPEDAISRLGQQGQLVPAANVTATLSGVVTERTISRGQVSQPGDPMFTVADLSTVWVVGALPEQAARSVQPGQPVEVTVPALGDRRLRGRLVFVSDTVSPETRTVAIRTEVDNRTRELKPQMLATLRIEGARRQQLAVPAGAVVREGDRDHVFVQSAPDRFRLTPVDLGPAVDGLRPVLKGLDAGNPVVVEGAFHMNNERKRAELE